MAEVEKLYTIPLRVTKTVPVTRRAKRAVTEVRKYIARHMKAKIEDIWIDSPVNEKLWERGTTKPPTRIRVKAIKFDDGVVEVSLPEE